jgi:hypothetical protein
LRGIQSVVQIAVFYPVVQSWLVQYLQTTNHTIFTSSLSLLSGRIGLIRRTLRTFRFLDSFNAGWEIYAQQDKNLEAWLDVLNRTALGMYGMLESVTLLDVFELPELRVFDVKTANELNRQAMIFWFVALYASVVSCAVKALRLYAYRPVPLTGGGHGVGEDTVQETLAEKTTPTFSADHGHSQKDQVDREQRLLREMVQKRKEEGKTVDQQTAAKLRQLGVKFAADALDMVLPASAVSWIQIDRGVVAWVMLTTSIITGRVVWKNCAQALEAEKQR